MEWVLLSTPKVAQLLKNFATFIESESSLQRTCHWSLPLARWIQSIPSLHPSIALQPFVGSWHLIQFCNLFYTVGRTPWTGDQPVARPLPTYRTTQTQNKGIHTNIHALSGFWTHDPSVRASEDSSCLRPRGQSIPPHPISLKFARISSFHLGLRVPIGLFHSGFPIKLPECIYLLMRAICHAISSSLAWLFWFYLAKGTNYEAPHYVVFSNLLSFDPHWVQIFSSASSSQISPVYVLTLMSKDQVSHPYKTTVYRLIYTP
jgi:hypothetical protein